MCVGYNRVIPGFLLGHFYLECVSSSIIISVPIEKNNQYKVKYSKNLNLLDNFKLAVTSARFYWTCYQNWRVNIIPLSVYVCA